MAARFGWQTNASWRDTLIEAIQAKADKLGLDELSYCQQAIRSPGELEVLAGLLCNSETRFFREGEQFEALMTRVLPELITARGKERKLALWSAACSTVRVATLISRKRPIFTSLWPTRTENASASSYSTPRCA